MRSNQLTSDTADAVNDVVNQLLSDGVVATGIWTRQYHLFHRLTLALLVQLLAASSFPLINNSGWKS